MARTPGAVGEADGMRILLRAAMRDYLENSANYLEERLRAAGYRARLHVQFSEGAVSVSVIDAAEKP